MKPEEYKTLYVAYDLDNYDVVAEGSLEQLSIYTNDYGIMTRTSYDCAIELAKNNKTLSVLT